MMMVMIYEKKVAEKQVAGKVSGKLFAAAGDAWRSSLTLLLPLLLCCFRRVNNRSRRQFSIFPLSIFCFVTFLVRHLTRNLTDFESFSARRRSKKE